ncbi:MAG: hypothetical protein PVH68_17930, partial [Armatimonadota bacterium]
MGLQPRISVPPPLLQIVGSSPEIGELAWQLLIHALAQRVHSILKLAHPALISTPPRLKLSDLVRHHEHSY